VVRPAGPLGELSSWADRSRPVCDSSLRVAASAPARDAALSVVKNSRLPERRSGGQCESTKFYGLRDNVRTAARLADSES
jgi:hypothetical protein